MKIKVFDKFIKLNNIMAWELSRPMERNTPFKNVASLDLPVNEFQTLNLFIESTIVEREIFATIRNHIIWAQTSRVQNVLEFEMPDNLKHINSFEHTRNTMRQLSKNIRQDNYRQLLPIFSNTKYSISTNPRQLIKVCLYLKYLSQKASCPNIYTIFINSYHDILHFLKTLNYSEEIISNYKLNKIFNEAPINKINKVVGNYIVLTATIPLSLRAQLFRHRNILCDDTIFHLLTLDCSQTLNLTHEVECQISCTIETLKELFAKRNCWIAQYNIWKPLLDAASKIMEIKQLLPCNDGACPFDKDAMLRYEDKDPNPPCPIHIKLKQLNVSEQQAEAMRKMVIEDRRQENFWLYKINMLELDK